MLPRIDTPTYDLIIPSNKQRVKYRPFLVKEEKILLMAQEGENIDEKVDAVKQIIRNCVLQDIDVDKLSTFDIEYIFVNLRSKSVGNIVELNYKREGCDKKEEEKVSECNLPFILDLEQVKVEKIESNSSTINLTDTISLKMKYPDFKVLNKILKSETYEDLVEVICSCIEQIYQNDEMFVASDHTTSELKEFVESMTQSQFDKINDFFESIPETSCDITVVCKKCGFKKELKVKGISDFFF